MLSLTVQLAVEADGPPAAREASAKLSRADWRLLVAFAQAVCVEHELRDPNRLIVVETREIARS